MIKISDILRQGARKLLAEALQAEVASFMALYADLKDVQGRQKESHAIGTLPEQEIQTGIGPVAVKVPRDRDTDQQTGRILIFEKPKAWKSPFPG